MNGSCSISNSNSNNKMQLHVHVLVNVVCVDLYESITLRIKTLNKHRPNDLGKSRQKDLELVFFALSCNEKKKKNERHYVDKVEKL